MALHLAQRADLAVLDWRRAIAAAVEQGRELVERHVLDQHQVGRHDGAAVAARMPRAIKPPGELAVAPQDAPDALAHRPPVAAADKAASAEERVGDQIGGPLGAADDLI